MEWREISNAYLYLQDLLLQNQSQKQPVHSDLVIALLIVVTCITCITLVIILIWTVSKVAAKGAKKARTDAMPLHFFPSNGVITSDNTDTNTIRTISTAIPDSRSPPRIPTEDRVSSESGYDNPVLVPSPSNNRRRLPPL